MARKAPARRGVAARLARWLILGPILVLVGYLALCTLLLVAYRWVPPPVTTVQVQRALEATLSSEDVRWQRSWRPMAHISPHVPNAVVAAEDTRFFQHSGFDWEELEIARAQARQRGTAMRGASTITQQLVKNLFLTTHRSYIRKGLEFPLTFAAEALLPKDRILELYVNVVEWGPGVYGIEAAAQHHYGIGSDAVSREQAARLAAVLPAPRSRTPNTVRTYSRIIMQRMWQMGW